MLLAQISCQGKVGAFVYEFGGFERPEHADSHFGRSASWQTFVVYAQCVDDLEFVIDNWKLKKVVASTKSKDW